MRNKFSTFLLALLMTVSSTFYFVGCGGNNNNSNEGSDSGNPPAEHTHTYDTEWENDENYHWHKATCEHTSEVSDKGEHVWDAGVETEEATYDSEGEMLFTCTVCGKTYTEVIGIKDFSIDPNEVEVSDIHRLHTDGMLAYLQGDKEDVFNYADGSEERSIPKAVSLTWDAVQGATQYSITIAENREDCSFIWENYFHEEEDINEYDLTIFVKEENGMFRRFQENHYQRGYTVETMISLVEEAGLEIVEVLDVDTKEAVTDESERVYIVARECQK